MTTMTHAHRCAQLLMLATLLVGTGVARQDTSLRTQMSGMVGTGLTIGECRDRMQRLGTLLEGAGYGGERTQTLSDGTLASRWSHPVTKTTVLAFSGQNAVGNAFTVAQHDGLITSNELFALP